MHFQKERKKNENNKRNRNRRIKDERKIKLIKYYSAKNKVSV